MNEEEYKEWQEELRIDGQEEHMEDRRFANRSAEEVLEDIEEWFNDNYADTLEQCYNKLRAELQDYGLDTSVDDIFTNCLDNCTNWRNPLATDVAVLRRIIKESQLRLS